MTLLERMKPSQRTRYEGLMLRWDKLEAESTNLLFKLHPWIETPGAKAPENAAELEKLYTRNNRKTALVIHELIELLDEVFPPKKVFKMVPFNEYKPQENGPKRP